MRTLLRYDRGSSVHLLSDGRRVSCSLRRRRDFVPVRERMRLEVAGRVHQTRVNTTSDGGCLFQRQLITFPANTWRMPSTRVSFVRLRRAPLHRSWSAGAARSSNRHGLDGRWWWWRQLLLRLLAVIFPFSLLSCFVPSTIFFFHFDSIFEARRITTRDGGGQWGKCRAHSATSERVTTAHGDGSPAGVARVAGTVCTRAGGDEFRARSFR